VVNGRIRLVHGLIDAAGGPVLQERKTKNANNVDLDAETVELLRIHREQCAERAAARGVRVEDCPLFAAADVTASWKPNWVTKRFGVALDHAGVEHFRLHDLRHFVATQMLAAGRRPAGGVGTSSPRSASTTLNIYAASMPAWDRAAAETLSTLIRAS
jgi:integrase